METHTTNYDELLPVQLFTITSVMRMYTYNVYLCLS